MSMLYVALQFERKMYVKNPVRFVSTFVTVASGAFGILLLDYVTMGLKTASNPQVRMLTRI